MRYIVDHDYHIHSQLSLCSQHPEQTNENILQYARDNGFSSLCLTNHHWDEKVEGRLSSFYEVQNYPHIAAALPLPQGDGIDFYFGCEVDIDRFLRIGIAPESYDRFKFIVIPTTHLHMVGFTANEEDLATPEKRAETWIKRFETVLNADLPFHKVGLAHLACHLIAPTRGEYLEVLRLLPTEKLEELFLRAAKRGLGIELNYGDFRFSDEEADTVLRIFKIAKQMGCKFYLGSDAHNPTELLAAPPVFERAVDLLELSEEDKFHIS